MSSRSAPRPAVPRGLMALTCAVVIAVSLAFASRAAAVYDCFWSNSACATNYIEPDGKRNSGIYNTNGLFMNTAQGYAIYSKILAIFPTLNLSGTPTQSWGPVVEGVMSRTHSWGNYANVCRNYSGTNSSKVSCGWFH